MATKRDLWHAYVDESGDRGWKVRPLSPTPASFQGSSGVFTATSIMVPDGAQSAHLVAWGQATQDVGRPLGTPIHWLNVHGHGQRRHLVRTIASQPDLTAISVVLCKYHLPNAGAIKDSTFFYHWTLRLLLERISWFAKDRDAEMTLTFAQVKGITPATITAYVTRLQGLNTNIEWGYLKMPAKIDTPPRRRMLQLADTASGAIHRAFEPDNYGFTEQVFLNDLKPVIWRRYRTHSLAKSGLKLGPWPDPDEALHVPWFKEFCDPAK